MVHMPPGYSNFRPWSNVGPRQMMMPRPTRPMMNYSYMNTSCNSYNSGLGTGGWIALGIGGVLGFLPTVLSWFGIGGGGGGKADGITQQNQQVQQNTANNETVSKLNTAFGDYNWICENGEFIGVHKEDSSKQVKGKSFTEIATQFQSTKKPTDDANSKTLTTLAQDKGLTVESKEGKYTITDSSSNKVYEGTDLNAALKAVSKYSTTPTNTKVGNITQEQITELQTEAAKKGITNVEVKANNDGGYTVTYTQNGESKTETAENLDDIKTKLGIVAENTGDGNPIDNTRKVGGGTTTGTSKYKKAELPEGYDWGVSNGQYAAGTSVDKILKDLQNDSNLANITKQQLLDANPTAIKDGVVSGKGKLEIPMSKQNANASKNSWSIKESGGWFSGDAHIKASDGKVYEIECKDGDRLNYGENKLHLSKDGKTIALGADYQSEIHNIVNRETGEKFPVEYSTTDDRILVKIGDKQITIEEFLSNQETYIDQTNKSADTGKLPTWATTNPKGGMTVAQIAEKLPEGTISGDATSITITFKNSQGATVSAEFTNEDEARKYITNNMPKPTPANS